MTIAVLVVAVGIKAAIFGPASVSTSSAPAPRYSQSYPTSYYSPYTTTVPAPATTTTTAPAAGGEVVTVTRVIDGDTIEVNGIRRVRVLGIDACEASTPGGREATEIAQSQFSNPYNAPITLLREPGVDLDRYGRELRYVHLGASDFGEFMIIYPHVGVYEGQNDAAPAYVQRLRAADQPRDCSGTVAPVPSDTDVNVDADDDDDRESRFCRGRWYC